MKCKIKNKKHFKKFIVGKELLSSLATKKGGATMTVNNFLVAVIAFIAIVKFIVWIVDRKYDNKNDQQHKK